MLPKYKIEYAVPFRNRNLPAEFATDDPVACEQFVAELLEKKFKLRQIKHDGLELSSHEVDRIVKAAANILAAEHVCAALGVNMEEERFRFGFAA